MCDINVNTKKYNMLCHVCLSSDRKLSVLGDYDSVFRKICNYPFKVPNIYLCWECIAMLDKIQIFQARVVKAQELLHLNCAEKQYIQSKTLSNLRICPRNQLIDILYDEELDIEQKTELYEEKIELLVEEKIEVLVEEKIELLGEEKIELLGEEKIELLGEDKKNVNEEEKIYIKNAEIKEEIEDYDNINDYSDNDIKEEFLELIKQQNELKNDINKKSKTYKYVFHIKDDEFIKKFNTDYENIKRWLKRDRDSDTLKKIKFKCMKCLCIWKSKTPLMKHQRSFHSAISGMYFCDICASRFKTKQAIVCHMKKHAIALECVVCAFRCSSPDVMKIHLRSHKSAVQCLSCDIRFENIRSFRAHYKAVHASFVCDHCGKRCLKKQTLERHMRYIHNFDNLECKHCKKKLKTWRSLRKHLWLRHLPLTSSELAYCAPCDKQFKTRGLYIQHLHSSIKHVAEGTVKPKVPCPECGNAYSRKLYMLNHYRHVHMKRTNYHCSICDKYFLNSTRYREHMTYKHEGITKVKDKICTVCGRGFSDNRILTHHMRTHSGERPFECSHCGSRFAQKYAMQTHVKNIHGKKS